MDGSRIRKMLSLSQKVYDHFLRFGVVEFLSYQLWPNLICVGFLVVWTTSWKLEPIDKCHQRICRDGWKKRLDVGQRSENIFYWA